MTQPQEVIPREKLLRFWGKLDADTKAALRAAAEDGAELPANLVATLAPVLGSVGAKWESEAAYTFWMTNHLREFVTTQPAEDEG